MVVKFKYSIREEMEKFILPFIQCSNIKVYKPYFFFHFQSSNLYSTSRIDVTSLHILCVADLKCTRCFQFARNENEKAGVCMRHIMMPCLFSKWDQFG